jgi:dolichol-phosphate mannosyltransferase
MADVLVPIKEDMVYRPATSYSRVTVIVPTLNESGNIGPLLDELSQHYPGIHVIVADDDSTDGTRDEVAARARNNTRIRLLWRRGKTRGLTASVVDALTSVSTEYVAVMDGDLQHPPEILLQLLEPLAAGLPLAVGKRRRSNFSSSRRMLSWIASALGRLRLWCTGSASCSDCLSGLFAGRTEIFHRIMALPGRRFELRGYKVLLDFLKHLPSDTPIAQVDYDFAQRRHGRSKLSAPILWFYLRSLLR